MCNSNLPIGTANDPFAPWNQKEQPFFDTGLTKEVYTECCGCDHFTPTNESAICGDCGQVCSVYEESDSDFEKRVEEAERKHFEELEDLENDC